MKLTYVSFGAVLLAMGMNLRHVLQPLPWGGAKVALWLLALFVLAMVVFNTFRTAHRLSGAAVEESRRAVYTLAFQALIAILLALSLPEVVESIRRQP
jgi:ABC-type proline/glycine betaine transport system permease subunit